MKLIVDNREPKELVTILKSRIENIESGNLDLGDFVIKNDDETVIIFERKSLSDLISSIKDGRYVEQSFRLSETSIHNHNIYYIIEGNISNFCMRNSETVQKMLFSAMFSLSYKKGFSILHTLGLVETAEFIIRYMDKLSVETPNSDISSNSIPLYSSTLKTTKKSNVTKENIGEIMLSQIPGVSSIVANKIMSEYKTIDNLIAILKQDSTCLDNLLIPYKNGSRKLSKNSVGIIKKLLT